MFPKLPSDVHSKPSPPYREVEVELICRRNSRQEELSNCIYALKKLAQSLLHACKCQSPEFQTL